MFHVAVCDDNEFVCREIEKILEDECNVALDVFFSGEKLYDAMVRGTCFDLIFLDIELAKMNGVAVADKIRNELANEVTSIVYISAKEEYAMKLFKTRPLDFIVKPFTKEQILDALNYAMRLSGNQKDFYEFKINQTYYKILLKDIIYVESSGRKIIIHTETCEYTVYSKLDEIENKFNNVFLRIHKSYLVNMNAIKEYQYDSVLLTNGIRLNISKINRNKVRDYLLESIWS